MGVRLIQAATQVWTGLCSRLRIRVRTLIVLVAAIAIPLGLWIRRADQQRRIVQMIREAGGTVVYGSDLVSTGAARSLEQRARNAARSLGNMTTAGAPDTSRPPQVSSVGPWWNRWIHEHLGPDYIDSVVAVLAVNSRLEGLSQIAELSSLKALNLGGTNIDDSKLGDLRRLISLEELYLGRTHVTNRGIRALSNIDSLVNSLRVLHVSHNSRITDETCESVLRLKGLEELDLNFTEISDAGLKTLTAHPRLKFISLSGTKVSKDAISLVKRARPSLKVVR